MAKSYIKYVGDGINHQFDVTFPYLNKSHVVVLFNGVSQTFEWVNDTRVQTDATPAASVEVKVARQTPTSALTVYQTASTLKGTDLTRSLAQSLYLAEENGDDADDSLALSVHRAVGDANVSLTIPALADRAGKLAAYDLTGAPTASSFSIIAMQAAADNAIAAAKVAGSDLWQRPVLSIATAPAVSPAIGDRYLVAHSGTSGVFVGSEDQVAQWMGDVWVFSGMPARLQGIVVQSDNLAHYWSGTAWLTGSALVDSFLSGSTGAVTRTVAAKLGDFVSVLDFGVNTTPGTTDMTAAVQAALNTGKDVLVPTGVFLITSKLTMSTAYQKLFGHGQLSELRFTFAADAVGLEITNSTGRQQVTNVFLNATAHVTKLVSLKAPMVILRTSRFVNATATGHVIYCEDENVGSNIFAFGLSLLDNFIYGNLASGCIGVNLGNNSQCAHIVGNYIENCGTLLAMQGNVSNVTVTYNVLQRSVDRAVFLGRTASNTYINVNFLHNYAEQNQVVFCAAPAEFHNCSIKSTYAYRNTASKPSSYFFLAQGVASTLSTGWTIEDNYVEDFFTFLQLGDEPASRMVSVKRNTMKTVTNYSDGSFPDYAYVIRSVNSYYNRKLTSGAFLSESNTRQECKNLTFEIPIPFNSREYLSHVTFNYVQTSGTGTVVEIHKVVNNTDSTLITSASFTTDGVKTVGFEADADPAASYYLKVIVNNTGINAYLYPFLFYFRK